MANIVGDIRTSHPANAEYYETVLRLLEEFMREHQIDRLDVGWSCPAKTTRPDRPEPSPYDFDTD